MARFSPNPFELRRIANGDPGRAPAIPSVFSPHPVAQPTGSISHGVRLLRRHAAVDHQLESAHEGALVASEEQDAVRDFLGRSNPTYRGLSEDAL